MLIGIYFIQTANDFGAIRSIPKKNVTFFRNDPKILVAHARDIEGQVNGMWRVFYSGSEMQ